MAKRKGTKRKSPRIPNELLREAFQRSDMSANELADILGWRRRHGKDENSPDASKVLTLLGLKTGYYIHRGERRATVRETMTEEEALAIGRALNLDPHEIGC